MFVPDGEVGHFLGQLEKYVDTTFKKPCERRHENVYDRVASVRLAALRALWTDVDEAFPAGDDDTIWWEVWLRRTDGQEVERLYEYCVQTDATVSPRRIEFDDRIVTLVFASPNTLAGSLDVMGDIAELQRAKETATFFVEEKPGDQAEWTNDLAGRTTVAQSDAPAVCLLDTGVNAGHPLLEGSLAAEDRHACDPTWGVDDDGGGPDTEGHGTEMAGKNDPDLYGAVTAEATSRPEIQAPTRRRVFSMAVTAKDGRDRGHKRSDCAGCTFLRRHLGRVPGPLARDDPRAHGALRRVDRGDAGSPRSGGRQDRASPGGASLWLRHPRPAHPLWHTALGRHTHRTPPAHRRAAAGRALPGLRRAQHRQGRLRAPAFHLPRLLCGESKNFIRATAGSALHFAEDQILQPKRDEFDYLINRKLLADMGIRFSRFRSQTPVTRDPERMTAMVEKLVRVGC